MIVISSNHFVGKIYGGKQIERSWNSGTNLFFF